MPEETGFATHYILKRARIRNASILCRLMRGGALSDRVTEVLRQLQALLRQGRSVRLEGVAAAALLRDYFALAAGGLAGLIAAVLLFSSQFVRPASTIALALVFLLGALVARFRCDAHNASRIAVYYAVFSSIGFSIYLFLSHQVALTALMAAGYLPVLTIVAGSRAAMGFFGMCMSVAVGLYVADRFDIEMPRYFAGAPLGVLVLSMVSLTTVMLPLPRLLSSLQRELSHRERLQAQLRRAAEEAEAANHAKSEFLATMSHEIRTPMNGIVGMTALALEGDLSAEQRESLQVVQQSAESLLNIINDILDLSKIEAGQMQLESVPMDLRSTLGAVLKMLSFNASNKGLELAADVADDVPVWVSGDPTRLRQVLINLVGNAIKFTAQGSVTVRVRCEATDARGSMLRLEVQDTGIGIPADKLEAIFQPFTQADSSTTRTYGGTGLGLTISRKLVGMMGGAIGVHSTPGQGSTFHFSVRFGLASAPVDLMTQTAIMRAQRVLRVLLVDDHPVNQALSTKMLERGGHQVSVAADGLQAIAQWRSLRPDVILMDVQMPVMDGLEATRAIRHAELREGLKRTPIVAATANAFAEDRQACLDAGMDGYLSKPFKPDVLQRTLVEVIAAAPSRVQ